MPIAVHPVAVTYTGLVITRHPLSPVDAIYRARIQRPDRYVHVVEFVGAPTEGWLGFAARLLAVPGDRLTRFEDAGRGVFRAVLFEQDTLVAATLITRGTDLHDHETLAPYFLDAGKASRERPTLLALLDTDGNRAIEAGP